MKEGCTAISVRTSSGWAPDGSRTGGYTGPPMPPLRRLRRLKGWSLRDLARESGVAVDTLLDLEHRARVPRPSTMRKIAAALGVEIAAVDEFREDDDPPPPR